jgi:hypothetical protein
MAEHSPSQTGVNALMARGDKETALRRGHVRNKRQNHNTSYVWSATGIFTSWNPRSYME